MPITSYNKIVTPDNISKQGTAIVQISLAGTPDIIENPTDIVLLIDGSADMAGLPLADAKTSAIDFVKLFAVETNPTDTTIGGDSRISILYFNDIAVALTQLINDVSTLIDAINSIASNNISDPSTGFILANSILSSDNPSSRKIIIIFTPGNTSNFSVSEMAAQQCKDNGIEIYCVGIGTNINTAYLDAYASLPVSSYVFIPGSSLDMLNISKQLVASIIQPAATNVELVDTIAGDFKILEAESDEGDVSILGNRVMWDLPFLGTIAVPSATLDIAIQHYGNKCGPHLVNRAISYTDDQTNSLYFPTPILNVEKSVNTECAEDVSSNMNFCCQMRCCPCMFIYRPVYNCDVTNNC